MIASIAPSDEIPSQTAQDAPARTDEAPASSPLSEASARIEALAAEIKAARAAPEPGAAAPAIEAGSPPPESPRLGLIPFIAGPKSETGAFAEQAKWAPKGLLAFAGRRKLQLGAAAACLAAIGLIGGATLVERSGQANLAAVQSAENQSLAIAIKGLKAKVEALEATKTRDDTADIRKTLAEMKAGLAASHDAGSGLAQLSARFDKAQRDQDARLAKLSEKIDRDGASRAAEITARLDKLEKKPATPVVAAIPAPVTPAPGPTTLQKQATALPAPATATAPSPETTGSIARPRPVLQSFVLRDVRNGLALIEGRDGEREVGPGDILPGAGRVERIERRGRDWAVLTSIGTIVGDGGAQPY